MEPSQLLNKVLGRNTDTGGVEFWRQPERSGWLMKQGEARGALLVRTRRPCMLVEVPLLMQA